MTGSENDDQPKGRSFGDRPDRATVSVTNSPTGARVVSTAATLDAAGAAELRREFSALLARSMDPLVVDLSAVRAVEPNAASVVLRHLAYDAGDADVDLRVVRDPVAHEVARAVLGDEALFEVYPTLEAAIEPRHRSDCGEGDPSTWPGRNHQPMPASSGDMSTAGRAVRRRGEGAERAAPRTPEVPMTITAPTRVDTTATTTAPGLRSVLLHGAAASVIAAAATSAAAAAGSPSVSAQTSPARRSPVSGFAVLTLMFAVVGLVIATALRRFARRPRTAWLRTTVTLTLLSFVSDACGGEAAAS